MSIRIVPDDNQPSASIEIALDKSLPDYDLDEVEQPTPRHVDEDVLEIDLAPRPHPLEITQLTGAICPTEDEVYRPGLWIVLFDPVARPRFSLPEATLKRISFIARELVKRLQLA